MSNTQREELVQRGARFISSEKWIAAGVDVDGLEIDLFLVGDVAQLTSHGISVDTDIETVVILYADGDPDTVAEIAIVPKK